MNSKLRSVIKGELSKLITINESYNCSSIRGDGSSCFGQLTSDGNGCEPCDTEIENENRVIDTNIPTKPQDIVNITKRGVARPRPVQMQQNLAKLREQQSSGTQPCPTFPLQNYGGAPPPFSTGGQIAGQILTCTQDQTGTPTTPINDPNSIYPLAYCNNSNTVGCSYEYSSNTGNWALEGYNPPQQPTSYCWPGNHNPSYPPFGNHGAYDQEIVTHTDGFEYLWCMGASAWVVQNDPTCNAECSNVSGGSDSMVRPGRGQKDIKGRKQIQPAKRDMKEIKNQIKALLKEKKTNCGCGK
tara:strand:- start:12124 stop:13020 length:897 start_codon:yes stop_codon:yes gene_type:complete